MRIRTLFLLLALCLPAAAQTPRILYVGDSWTYYPWAEQSPPALRTVLARPEIGLGQYVEDGSIALLHPTAAGWDAAEPKEAIRQKLVDNPTIDIVHISLGGNDVNLGLGGNFSPDHIASLNGTAVAHIENIVNFILSQRPDIRVAICGYDYLNITEGFSFNQFTVIQSVENPTAAAYLVYGLNALLAQDVLNNQNNVNDVFIDLEQRKLNLTQGKARTRYIHNFGLMQAVYGIPSLSIPPTAPANLPAGWSGNFSNFPAGNRDLFSPRQAMDGSSELDPIHLSDAAYLRLMENAVLQVYYQWLKDSEAPQVEAIEVASTTEAGGGTVDFAVTFTEDVSGVDATDFETAAVGVSDVTVQSVSGSGADYVVTVGYGEGTGTIRLDLVDDDSIFDAVWNPLGKKNLVHAAHDGDYRNGASVLVGGTAEGEDPEAEPVCTAPEGSPRVLIVGDSWAAGVFFTAALDEVMDEYGLTHVQVLGDTTAIGGSKAAQWATTEWLSKITQKLWDNPTIDTVHLIMGGNDILGHIKDTDVYEGAGALLRETWWEQIEVAISNVVTHCQSFTQIKKVVIADYDFLNRNTAQLLYALTGGNADFGGMTQYEVNQAFIEVGQRKLAIAQRTPNCEYVHNFGLLQEHFNAPSWAVRPGGPPNYQPYPGGDQTFPMPDIAFDPLVILDTVIAGDGIHPSEAAHKIMLRNAVEQVYLPLYVDELICPEGDGAEEGDAEGSIEEAEEGGIEGALEGEGAAEGMMEGEGEGAEGSTDGAAEGLADGAEEGMKEGTPEGGVEGTTDGAVEGGLEGLEEGVDEGTIEGAVDGAEEEGSNEGMREGVDEGGAEGSVDGATEGTADGEGEGAAPARHSADADGDGVLSLSELLRLIQLYNFDGGFGCGDDADGFALGSLLRDCGYHSSDYAEPRWLLTLSELLRGVQFFNIGGYWECKGASEDGFCPGEKPAG